MLQSPRENSTRDVNNYITICLPVNYLCRSVRQYEMITNQQKLIITGCLLVVSVLLPYHWFTRTRTPLLGVELEAKCRVRVPVKISNKIPVIHKI